MEKKMETTRGVRVKGQGYFESRLIMGITGVTVWLIWVVSRLTQSP